jgi:hypothetical protein
VAIAADPINKKPFIGVYTVSGTGHYQANINGGGLKSYGGAGSASAAGGAAPGGASYGSGAAPSGGGASGGANPQAIANCVSKAGGDPAKIQACAGG